MQNRDANKVVTRGAAARMVTEKSKSTAVAMTRVPLRNKPTSNAVVQPPPSKQALVKPKVNPRKRPGVPAVGISQKAKKVSASSQQKENSLPSRKAIENAQAPGKTTKPLPNIESIKKLNPTVDVLKDVCVSTLKKSRFEGWDDLDKDDDLDPLMVNEYVVEIFDYMKELEIETKPDPNYMTLQTELKWKMRSILVDWLADVHGKFRLLPETLYLAINLVDRFLSLRVVSCAKLQLVGVAAMFIASKYEEVCHPTIANFIHLTDGGYVEEEVLKAERYLLQVLNFGLQYPNPMNFLRRCSKAENYNLQTRTLAKYLMEITLMDHQFLGYVPSIIAAAGLYLARKMLNSGQWDINLSHYSSYSEEELKPVVKLMIGYLSKPVQFDTIYTKYCNKKFMKSAIFVDNWIQKHVSTEEKRAAEARALEAHGSSEFEEDGAEESSVQYSSPNPDAVSDRGGDENEECQQ